MTSGGVCILWKKHLSASPLPPHLHDMAYPYPVTKSRCIFSLLQLKKTSLLICELYPWTGKGVQDVNLDLLMHAVKVSRCLGFPVLIAGDVQASASELVDSAILHAANFTILTSTSPATHGERTIDHLLVSSWAACLFSTPVVAPQVRSDHLSVSTTVCRAPLSLHAMQCKKPRYIDNPSKKEGPVSWDPDLWAIRHHVAGSHIRHFVLQNFHIGFRGLPRRLDKPPRTCILHAACRRHGH